MAKVKYSSVVLVALVMMVINIQPVFADQATSNVGITFTGHWEQPGGGETAPPVGNSNGDQMTVVSNQHSNQSTNAEKLPQTGVSNDLLGIQMLGVLLTIMGLGILIKQKDGISNEKK